MAVGKGYRVEFRCAEAAGVSVEEFAKKTGVSRSEAWRQIMRRGLESYTASTSSVIQGDITPIQPAVERGHVLSDAEWKVWLWLNDLAEKSYLGGAPIKIGRNIDGLRFRLEPITDPDLEIP
jgi:hypothetical protein